MPIKKPIVEETPSVAAPNVPLIRYTCERCGFEYNKVFDFAPFLCYRCMRFIAKRVFIVMNTITPLGRPDVGDL